MSRVTIKSIAADLGISHMTVSRALSNHPNVQKETRAAVQKRARELGYIKSTVAMVMRGQAPNIVGLLLPNIVNEFYASFANALALSCDAHSLQLIIHLTNDDPIAEEQALERLQEVQAASVVMVPAPRDSSAASAPQTNLRMIELIRQRSGDGRNPAILVNDTPAIQAAVQYLAEQGHRQIAYIGGDQSLSSGQQRLAAFRAGLDLAGLSETADLICTGAPSFSMGHDHMRDLATAGRATACVCGGFEISNGALSAVMAAQANTKTPIELIGYGDPSFYTWVDQGVSTIQVPVAELAQHAIDVITAAPDAPVAQVALPAKLILR